MDSSVDHAAPPHIDGNECVCPWHTITTYSSIEPSGPSKVTFFSTRRLADRFLVCALLGAALLLPLLHETSVYLNRWERVDRALQVYPRGGFHAFVPMAQPPHGCLLAFTAPEQGLHGGMALVAAVADLYRGGGAIDLYAMGAFKNMARLRNSTSLAGMHTILLVSAPSACDNSNASRAALGMAFASGWGSVCCVDPAVMGAQDSQLVPERLRHTFDRLIVWGFTNYSLVLYIDSDTVVLDPHALVHSFPGTLLRMQEQGNFLACYRHWDRHYPNSGVMFARPSAQVLQGLRGVVRVCNSDPPFVYRDGSYRGYPIWTYTNVDGQEIQLPAGFHQRKTSCWSDQAVVDTYFTRISAASNNLDRAYTPLSSTLNTVAYEAYQNLGARTVQDLAHVVVLHFVSPKPWNFPECDLWWGLQPWCQIWRDAPLQ